MSAAVFNAVEQAVELHKAGRLDEAAAVYQQTLANEPDHHQSLHLLGLLAYQRGDNTAAIELIGRAIDLCPLSAAYHNNLGNAHRAAGRLSEAAGALATAFACRTDSAEIATNYGGVLADLELWPEAVRILRAAVALGPNLAEAHYNLANALCGAGEMGAALPVYAECLRLRPHFADAHFNLGRALAALGQAEAAATSYRAVLRVDPRHAAAHNNLGVLLRDADRVEEAAACFAEALRLAPTDDAVACNLGAACLAMGRIEAAAACFAGVLDVMPDHGPATFGHLMSHLPVVARDAAEVATSRAAYADALAALTDRAANPAIRAKLAAGGGTFQPFFLAYQGGDDRPLQQAYGALRHCLASSATLVRPPAAGERLRVGIVSGHFREHTVWTLFLHGWLTQLDRTHFALFGYHTGSGRDAQTAAAAAACERFVEGVNSQAAWRANIAADAPHVLLYPEIGMDPVAARLAAERLAPLQCAAWGHPVTTGLPTIDVYLSGELMEPPDGPAHYTEQLALLPNLGVFCTPTASPPRLDRAVFGLRPDAIVYWSGQNLPKYHPDHDDIFARIAHEVQDSQFVFIAFGHGREMTQRFSGRLERAFARHGLDAAHHCVMLPQMPQQAFLSAAATSDVVLDTIGWSGGKSTLDMLAVDPAIVTLPGRFMRGRHTAAILRRIGAVRTIAGSVDEYVELAVRLGRDGQLRAEVRAEVARAKHRVFHDHTAVAALETLLSEAFRATPQPRRSASTAASATGLPGA